MEKIKIKSITKEVKKVFSTEDGFHFVENQIKDVISSGVKKTIKVSTYHDKNFKCTEDHKIQTISDGLVPLKKIQKNQAFFTSLDNCKTIETDKIISVEDVGFEDCFDLSLKKDPHTFFANGICVSNSHAISYGTVSYLMMYIKTYYPIYFYAIHFDLTSEKNIANFVLEAANNGIKISPPDVNNSKENFFVFLDKIFWSLKGIKGIGPAAVAGIVRNQPFLDNDGNPSLEVFCSKKSEMKCTKATIFALIRENAFSDFGTKEEVLEEVLKLIGEYPEDDDKLRKRLSELEEKKRESGKWTEAAKKRNKRQFELNEKKKINYEKYRKDCLKTGFVEEILLISGKLEELNILRKKQMEFDDRDRKQGRKVLPLEKIEVLKSLRVNDGEEIRFICFVTNTEITKVAGGRKLVYRQFLFNDYSGIMKAAAFQESADRYKNFSDQIAVVRLRKAGKYWNISLIKRPN